MKNYVRIKSREREIVNYSDFYIWKIRSWKTSLSGAIIVIAKVKDDGELKRIGELYLKVEIIIQNNMIRYN